jgi:hypothetical protein
MPVILATLEAEIRKIMLHGQLRQSSQDPISINRKLGVERDTE